MANESAKELLKGAAVSAARTAVKKVSDVGHAGASAAVNKAVHQLSTNSESDNLNMENSDQDELKKDSEALKTVHNTAQSGKSVANNVYRNTRQAVEIYQKKKGNGHPSQQPPGTGYPPGQMPQPGQTPTASSLYPVSTAKSVRTASTKAASSAARTAVNASAGAVRTVASASAGTAKTVASVSAGSAATAATGGAAAVVLVPVGIVKAIGRAAMSRLQNSPIKRIFGSSGSNSGGSNLNAGFGPLSPLRMVWTIVTAPLTILGAVIGLIGIFLLIFVIIIVLVMSSPLQFLFSGDDELGEILQGEEWSTLMSDFDLGEDGELLSVNNTNLQQLYDAHMSALNSTVSEYQEAGYRSVYDGYEGTVEPENYRAVVACLIGICTGQTSMEAGYSVTDVLFLTDSAEELFSDLLDAMCSFSVDQEKERIHIQLMSCEDYIAATRCSSQVAENIRTVYAGIVSVQGNGGGSQELPENIERYLSGLTHLQAPVGTAIQSALGKLGMPYSQANRDSGNSYDCSSFVYYSYKAAGISIVYGGANTAAAEAQYCVANGRVVTVEELQPGDLLFYSYVTNGRYKNISHVEMYLGNGLIIDCTETPGVAVRQFTADRLVLCGRPY